MATKQKQTAKVIELPSGRKDIDLSILDPTKALQGLTGKQEEMALAIFQGATNLEAYERVYDVTATNQSNKFSTACHLAGHPKVVARIRQLQMEREQSIYDDAESLEDFVLTETKKIAQDKLASTKDRLKALEMLGKSRHVMLFKESIAIENDTRTPAQILEDIRQTVNGNDAK